MKRRSILGTLPGATLGGAAVSNTLLNLRLLQNATASPSNSDDYKALVCVFLAGGNDAYNTLVPTSTSEYANYQAVRSNLALPAPGAPDGVLPLNVANTGGRTFGIHPAMSNFQRLFNDGNAAFLANVGTLIDPNFTAADVRNNRATLPAGIFGHNTQQRSWATSVADNLSARTGWGGRLADSIMSRNPSNDISMNISAGRQTIFLTGNDIGNFTVNSNGSTVLEGSNSRNSLDVLRTQVANTLVEGRHPNNILMDEFVQHKRRVYQSSAEFAESFDSSRNSTGIGGDLGVVARTINARRDLGHCRQIFYVTLPSFDTHGTLLGTHNRLLGGLDRNIKAFWDEMVAQGLEDNVTLFTASDFGRTLRSNGSGTDHAWGGHSMIVGGSVRGRRIYGQYPNQNQLRLGDEADSLDVGTNGRMLPTTSVDEYFAELALWFGLAPRELDEVFPNLNRFYRHSASNPSPIGFMG